MPNIRTKAVGDFGYSKKSISENQIVGIYDLVGFTTLDSNDELVTAVRTMEGQLELKLKKYYWDEKTTKGIEKNENQILLRPTGDGYILAFSHNIDDLEALEKLTSIYKAIHQYHEVRLGINKGENYVISDLNDRVNLIGWGINLASRALLYAMPNQIIITEHLAKPLIETHGDTINGSDLKCIGRRKVKQTSLILYNYYKKGQFGVPK